ncbi:MAG: SPOR domain-containing protein, partial [Alphaproteobacteria bacterium]|nr:SPOR domain-containing protein [Alphaproteobacteria bacterium]
PVAVAAAPVARAPSAAAPPAPEPTPVAVAEAEPAHDKPGLLRAAKLALQHLSPVSKAEAAPLHEAAEPGGERMSIQLGAFRAENAAERTGRAAAALPVARGKTLQIMQPAKGDKEPLYRARLLNFSPKEAQEACTALHKKKIECTIVRAAPVKVASR